MDPIPYSAYRKWEHTINVCTVCMGSRSSMVVKEGHIIMCMTSSIQVDGIITFDASIGMMWLWHHTYMSDT